MLYDLIVILKLIYKRNLYNLFTFLLLITLAYKLGSDFNANFLFSKTMLSKHIIICLIYKRIKSEKLTLHFFFLYF